MVAMGLEHNFSHPLYPDLSIMLSKFPVGTRIKLIALQEGEALTLPAGTIGTVRGVDDEPSLLMGWDNGSTLKLYPDGDEYEIIK